MKEISIIIVTWNSEEYIEDCLTAIKKGDSRIAPTYKNSNGAHSNQLDNHKNCSYEIIMIDNASQDKTVELVKKKFPNIRIIENSSNLGLSRAVNQGVKASCKLSPTSEYILLLNPDVVVKENAIQKLYQFMEQKKNVGACGPRFWTPSSGKLQRSCRELPSFKNLFTEFSGLGRLTKCSSWKMWDFDYNVGDTHEPPPPSEVEQPMGSCLLIRKKVFDEIGGMNPRYPIFMNDVDLCYRIKKAGHKIYFVPSANVNHHLGGSTRKAKRKMILEEHWSMYHYLKDHFIRVGKPVSTLNRFLVSLYAILLLISTFYRILFSFFKKH